MSATNKVLLIFIAVVAFASGVMLNSGNIKELPRVDTLLNAKLMVADSDVPNSIKAQLGEVTLVNFWASWCSPCREEMPIFEAMVREFEPRGFQVIGIAIDSPDKTRAMLDSMDISYPIFYAEQTGMLLMEGAGNPDGFLPYSLLIDKAGNVLQQRLGRINESDIATWIEDYL